MVSTGISVRKVISDAINNASQELRKINLEIWNNPEVMFEEVRASKLIADWLESKGWSVKRGVYGIGTAFEAKFSVKEGGRTLCYNAEYDALPQIGHACGHNLIATSSLASAVGVSAAIEAQSIPGTLILMGTPAEETGGGKWIMANHGAWRDVSVCIMTHPVPSFSTPICNMKASLKFRATFHGRSAHAAGAPHEGANACDAIVLAYNGLALLRQHIQKSESIQSVILSAGKAPNVIPDFAEGSYSIRGRNARDLEALKKRVIPIFEGAAAATGCEVKMIWGALYEDIVSNQALANRYRDYMISDLGTQAKDMLPLDEATRKYEMNASSDMGNCTYIAPGIQALFSINAKDSLHTHRFQEAAGLDFAHEEALKAGKANAYIGIDVLMDDGFYAEVRSEWETSMKEAGRL